MTTTTDWLFFSTITDEGGGIQPWTNPNNVKAVDGNEARTYIDGSDNAAHTSWLRCTGINGGPDFSNTWIKGVQIRLRNRAGAAAGSSGDISGIRLVKGNTKTGDDKEAQSSALPKCADNSCLRYDTYGGEFDTWGWTITPNDINSTFGVAFRYYLTTNGVAASGADVDSVQIKITYETSGGLLLAI